MSKPGRNEPCPCGSGRKYKHCCLSKQRQIDIEAVRDQTLEHAAFGPGAPERGLGSIASIDSSQSVAARAPGMAGLIQAPFLAHLFGLWERVLGRLLFEANAVRELRERARELSAWVVTRRREFHSRVGQGEEDATIVLPECTCEYLQRGSLCGHLYALLLAHDAALLARRGPWTSSGGAGSPEHFEAVAAAWLARADQALRSGKYARGEEVHLEAAQDALSGRMRQALQELANDWHASVPDVYDPPASTDDAEDVQPDLFEESDATRGDDVAARGERRLRHHERRAAASPVPALRRGLRLCFVLTPERGVLRLELRSSRRTRTGKWGKATRLRLSQAELRLLPDEQRRLFALLLDPASARDGDRIEPGTIRLGTERIAVLLPRIVDTGSCSFVPEPGGEEVLLRLGKGESARFVVRGCEVEGRFALRGDVAVGHRILDREREPYWLIGAEHVIVGDRLLPLAPLADAALARSLLEHGPIVAGEGGRERFLRRFVQLPGSRHIEDDSLLEADRAAQPRMILDDPEKSRSGKIGARVEFDYGDGHLGFPGAESTHFVVGGLLRARDPEFEARALARLDELGLLSAGGHIHWHSRPHVDFELRESELDETVITLVDEGWEVLAAGLPVRRGPSPALHVRTSQDWFEIEGESDFGGQLVSLPELLRLAEAGKRRKLVRLGDGSFGILASSWLERWRELLSLGEIRGNVVRLRSQQAWLLDAMLADHAGEQDVDAQVAQARAALRGCEQVSPREPAPGFAGELRSYQREGLGWLAFLREIGLGGCLADDMGLGKTVQVLALLDDVRTTRSVGDATAAGRGGPHLVVAPRSLLDNWQREAARFCPLLRSLVWFGPQRESQLGSLLDARFAGIDLVLTTYGTLRRDIERLRAVHFDTVILDEAQAIKNERSLASKSVRLLRCDHRLALTGTPIENHLGELWALFEFLNPGMLGRSRQFERMLATSKDASGAALAGELQRALRPLLLRRTKEEVLKDLPPKTEQVLHVALPPAQRRRYDELREHYRRELGDLAERASFGDASMAVLEALLRLRQAACHPGLIAAECGAEACGKFDVLLPMLSELVERGHKALVFSQFTQLLGLLRDRLEDQGVRYESLDGKTRDRQARVDRFQEDPECGVFLISLRAGGVGLNLTAADYVFLLDPWWNPAVESQAIDRAHRLGQTRPIVAYRLIAKNTIEERIADLQAEKRALADSVLAGDFGLAGLEPRDLARLLE